METLQINIISNEIEVKDNRYEHTYKFNKDFRKKYNKFIRNKSEKCIVIKDKYKFVESIRQYIGIIEINNFPKKIILGGEPLSDFMTTNNIITFIDNYIKTNNINSEIEIVVSGEIGYNSLKQFIKEIVKDKFKQIISFTFIIDKITNGQNGLNSFVDYMRSNISQTYTETIELIKSIENKKIRVLIDDIESKFEYNILALHSIFNCPIEIVFDYDILKKFNPENYLTLQRITLLFYKWKIYKNIDFIQFFDEPCNCLDHQLINGNLDLYIARHGKNYCKDNDIKFGDCYIQSEIMSTEMYSNITKILNVYKNFDFNEKPLNKLIEDNRIIKTKQFEL